MNISDLLKLEPDKTTGVSGQNGLMRPRVNRRGAVVEGAEVGVHSSGDDSDESGKFGCFICHPY